MKVKDLIVLLLDCHLDADIEIHSFFLNDGPTCLVSDFIVNSHDRVVLFPHGFPIRSDFNDSDSFNLLVHPDMDLDISSDLHAWLEKHNVHCVKSWK